MVVDVIRKKLGNYGKYFQSAFQLLSRVVGGGGNGGGRQTYFHEVVVDHLWCLWFILIEVHSMKHELPKSSILYTYMYTEDELKKVNH